MPNTALGVCTDCSSPSWACTCKRDAEELAKYEDAHPEIFDPNVKLQFNVRAYNREGHEIRTKTTDRESVAGEAAELYIREPQILKVCIHKVIL